MYGTPLYVKYERYHKKQTDFLNSQYDKNLLTEEEYGEALDNILDFDDWQGENIDRSEDK